MTEEMNSIKIIKSLKQRTLSGGISWSKSVADQLETSLASKRLILTKFKEKEDISSKDIYELTIAAGVAAIYGDKHVYSTYYKLTVQDRMAPSKTILTINSKDLRATHDLLMELWNVCYESMFIPGDAAMELLTEIEGLKSED